MHIIKGISAERSTVMQVKYEYSKMNPMLLFRFESAHSIQKFWSFLRWETVFFFEIMFHPITLYKSSRTLLKIVKNECLWLNKLRWKRIWSHFSEKLCQTRFCILAKKTNLWNKRVTSVLTADLSSTWSN